MEKESISVNKKRFQLASLALVLVAALGASVYAQGGSATTTNTRTVADGQKMTVKGVVTRRDIDRNTFEVQDANGVTTTVALTDRTSIKTKGGFFGGGSTYGASNILRGLNLEVDGRGNSSGQLVAEKVRFGNTDLRVAQSISSRVDPVESRVGNAEGRIDQVEANSQRLSGQLDELAAVSNAARGGAKAAQESADAAISGVNMTNERISALDDYTAQQSVNVNFKVASSVLTPEAKASLDQIAQQALKARGYVIEVRGFASAEGGQLMNERLSQRRADAVVRYLAQTHNIPLRRIITPFGYGANQPIADNKTRTGREQNRRVEVSVLVNRGIMQPAPEINVAKPDAATPPPQQ
ncbi:MAG: OmpA-OmpF porin, family [Acidobacteriota bacterium]|jgi:outer membrane protein OmpA-like peptidoglycan-associated protein|nr:OmpA-OmpF porin, family [Acidobacteriota bacterium]